MKNISEEGAKRIYENQIKQALFGKQRAKERYDLNPKVCKECQNKIPYEKRNSSKLFCNRSCSASYNNKKFPKRSSSRPAVSNGSCPQCKTIIPLWNKFCSRECNKIFYNNTYINNWKNGNEAGGTQVANDRIRKFIKQEQNNCCISCGLDTWLDQPIPLSLDHINGNPYDHSYGNLRYICANCDRLSDTFGIKNKGNGRHHRLERKRQGLSY